MKKSAFGNAMVSADDRLPDAALLTRLKKQGLKLPQQLALISIDDGFDAAHVALPERLE